MRYDTVHQTAIRAMASKIIEEVKKTVEIEIVKPYRKFLIRVYGGICEGVQVFEFDTRNEAVDYAVQHLYPFYMNRVGKKVNLKINA